MDNVIIRCPFFDKKVQKNEWFNLIHKQFIKPHKLLLKKVQFNQRLFWT